MVAEDQAFGEKLLQQPAAPGAYGQPDGHFMPAPESADQQQIADVRAGDEEHGDHHSERDSECWEHECEHC